MALGDSYATLTELKARIGRTTTEDDTRLTEALAAASRSVEEHCRRQFNKATSATARVFRGDGPYGSSVDDFWTTSGLIVKTDDSDVGTFATTWDLTDYDLYPLNGFVDGESGWPYSEIAAVGSRLFPIGHRRGPLQVTAQWGWPAVPAPVKEATLILAEALFKLKDAPFGVAGFDNFGSVRVRENPYVCMLLKKYVRNPVLVG